MITVNPKSPITTLILGFLLGCLATFLLMGGCNNGKPEHEAVSNPKELKKQADAVEISYQKKIEALQTSNQQFQQELKTVKDQLSSIKTKTKQKEATIKKIIEPKGFPAKDLLKKVNSPSVTMDTSQSDCDSLMEQVSEYIMENETKDSLYEVQSNIQDSIIVGKDFVIANQAELHQKLQTLFNQSLDQQTSLVNENSQLRKQFKRQKFRNKIFAVGVTILSGFTANYLLNH